MPETPIETKAPIEISASDLSGIKVIIDEVCVALLGPNNRCDSRELSLAVTNLQQARMWVNEHQRLA